jgi:RimJ/RimL family protein N-acetyltransferase|tara:strand:- start:6291 stop:6698 length:408 start_codon:yes stop_codon:yes gene_type:complete
MIRMRRFDIGSIEGMDNWRDVIRKQTENGSSATGIDDNGMVGVIGGVCVVRDGVGVAWAITSDLIVKYKIYAHRVIRDVVNDSFERFNLHRVEASIIVDHTVSHRWVERLGFKKEGLMRKFDHKQRDYYLYARVK